MRLWLHRRSNEGVSYRLSPHTPGTPITSAAPIAAIALRRLIETRTGQADAQPCHNALRQTLVLYERRKITCAFLFWIKVPQEKVLLWRQLQFDNSRILQHI